MDTEIQAPTDYNQIDVAMALRQLALYGGNLERTAAALTADGRPVDYRTLKSWRDTEYPIQYEEVVEQMRQEIGSKVSDGAMELAVSAGTVEGNLIEALGKQVTELEPQHLAKAALAMAQVKKNNIETARLLRNEPTAIVESRSVDESLDELRDLGVIDSTATEE